LEKDSQCFLNELIGVSLSFAAMYELLFLQPISKVSIKKPSRKGIPRVLFTPPAAANAIDPLTHAVEQHPVRKQEKF
jgi:hypothetical protein